MVVKPHLKDLGRKAEEREIGTSTTILLGSNFYFLIQDSRHCCDELCNLHPALHSNIEDGEKRET